MRGSNTGRSLETWKHNRGGKRAAAISSASRDSTQESSPASRRFGRKSARLCRRVRRRRVVCEKKTKVDGPYLHFVQLEQE